jgi:hypothetical protein
MTFICAKVNIIVTHEGVTWLLKKVKKNAVL